MNRYEEALIIVNASIMKELKEDEDVVSSLKTLQELVDRSTFKKAIVKEDFDEIKLGKCPVCNGGANSDMHYCMECGQRLDWDED